jgi:hypothetical protein
VTNGGIDVAGHAAIEYLPAGHHDGSTVSSGYSGDTVRMPDGRYDMHIVFSDGAAHKEIWIDNQNFTGSVDRSVEIGIPISEVTYIITNDGDDLKGRAEVDYLIAGRHDGNVVTSRYSDDSVRIPEGTYDVRVSFASGFIQKILWIDGQVFRGKVSRGVELGVRIAEPTVMVTRDAVDVGDKAHVDYLDPKTHEEVGGLSSG